MEKVGYIFLVYGAPQSANPDRGGSISPRNAVRLTFLTEIPTQWTVPKGNVLTTTLSICGKPLEERSCGTTVLRIASP